MKPDGGGYREVAALGAARPATDPGSLAGSCPGGQDGCGAVFAIPVQKQLNDTCVAVQCWLRADFFSRYTILITALERSGFITRLLVPA